MEYFCSTAYWYCILFYIVLHANVRYMLTSVHFSIFVSSLRRVAFQHTHWAALLGSTAAHASSGHFLGSLLSDRSAQLFCVAVADVMILLLFNFDGLRRLECAGYLIPQSV